MKKTILIFIIGIFCMLSLVPIAQAPSIAPGIQIPAETQIPTETQITTEPFEEIINLKNIEIEYLKLNTLEEANIALEKAILYKDSAIKIYENLLILGYQEDHPAVRMAIVDIENMTIQYEYYLEQQSIFQEARKWEIRASEYPIATQVWIYMKEEFGWNDIVCSGIIGNMMAECGGCWTQDLDWSLDEPGGYGMIQWIGSRREELFSIYGNSPSIEDQLNFMKDELYGTNGVTKQVTDYQLDAIMNAETPEDCAFAFASYFERCSEQYRYKRKGYARTAYEYFTN